MTFRRAIGTCAAVVQVGKAGGSDPETDADSAVFPYDPDTFIVYFSREGGDLFDDPFMMTVTCKN